MQHIRTGLDAIAAQLLRALPTEERVLAAWPHVCGRTVAARAHASRFEGATLYVQLDNPEWAQLNGLSRQYVARLRDLTGVAVEHISFEQKRTPA